MISILLDARTDSIINISSQLLDFVNDTCGKAFAEIGIGIGSIMLLFVVIYYITSILDGGKFQLKMLFPVFIYFLVCNFSWVSKPVCGFTTLLTTKLMESCSTIKQDLLMKEGGPDCTSILDLFWNKKMSENNGTSEVEQKASQRLEGNDKKINRDENVSNGEKPQDNQGSYNKEENVSGGLISSAINSSVYTAKDNFAKSLDPSSSNQDKSTSQKVFSSYQLTFAGLFAMLISWLVNIFALVLQAFGICLTALIVAFGPITFAFAIFPGKAGNMLSWFIRLCQYSLYAPIVSLLSVFFVELFVLMCNSGSGVMGFLLVISILIANFVLLLSTPTLASMIIEGASGAVSLSQGLQMLGSGLASAGSTVAGGYTLLAGKDNALSNFSSGLKQQGLGGFAKDAMKNGIGGAMGNTANLGHNINGQADASRADLLQAIQGMAGGNGKAAGNAGNSDSGDLGSAPSGTAGGNSGGGE